MSQFPSQTATEDATTASPCVRICELDDAIENCLGCGRTLEEIRHWRRMTDDEKRAVNERVGRLAGSQGD